MPQSKHIEKLWKDLRVTMPEQRAAKVLIKLHRDRQTGRSNRPDDVLHRQHEKQVAKRRPDGKRVPFEGGIFREDLLEYSDNPKRLASIVNLMSTMNQNSMYGGNICQEGAVLGQGGFGIVLSPKYAKCMMKGHDFYSKDSRGQRKLEVFHRGEPSHCLKTSVLKMFLNDRDADDEAAANLLISNALNGNLLRLTPLLDKSCPLEYAVRGDTQWTSLIAYRPFDGDLLTLLENHLDSTDLFEYALIKAMVIYLRFCDSIHNHGIVHLDSKLENMLATKTKTDIDIVCSDFGLSVRATSLREPGGTPFFSSPLFMSDSEWSSAAQNVNRKLWMAVDALGAFDQYEKMGRGGFLEWQKGFRLLDFHSMGASVAYLLQQQKQYLKISQRDILKDIAQVFLLPASGQLNVFECAADKMRALSAMPQFKKYATRFVDRFTFKDVPIDRIAHQDKRSTYEYFQQLLQKTRNQINQVKEKYSFVAPNNNLKAKMHNLHDIYSRYKQKLIDLKARLTPQKKS